ncbi:zona pellucida sperm-binding protein 4-like [Heterodontus francisci]|uniref:zona pellucida sperm-binding protein 4-like n=1 Tax=Heterodontus francisci TaxID=7792 RepID=UPI00355B718D
MLNTSIKSPVNLLSSKESNMSLHNHRIVTAQKDTIRPITSALALRMSNSPSAFPPNKWQEVYTVFQQRDRKFISGTLKKVVLDPQQAKSVIHNSVQMSEKNISTHRKSQITDKCPPSLFLPADKCWISPKFRQECGFAGIASSECVRRGCCFDVGSRDVPPCFYSLDNLPVCTKDGRVLIAISKDLTLPPVNLTTVHLKDGHGAECSPTVASVDTVLFEFALTECGTSQRLDGVDVVYETDVLAQFEILDGALGSVSRDSPFRLHVQCSYKGSQESELQLKPRVYTLSPPLPATETGILLLELRIARDAAYRSWYVASDYPILSVLREPVFVEVRVLNRNDPSLVLVLNECWASPTAEPYSQLQWKLLVNRCPFTGDNYKSRLLPLDAASHLRFPTHHKRFVVSTFTFWERVSGRPLSGEVYFHCSAEVCSPSSRENCTASCSPKRRRSSNDQSGTLVTTGPIIFLEDGERFPAGSLQSEKVCTKDGRVLIAISKDLTLPPVNLTTVHLKDGHGAECSPTVASVDTVLFEFALRVWH